jgi:hypothetical protein
MKLNFQGNWTSRKYECDEISVRIFTTNQGNLSIPMSDVVKIAKYKELFDKKEKIEKELQSLIYPLKISRP